MKKIRKDNILFFLMGVFITASFSVYATVSILSSQVDYNPRADDWTVTNVEGALDDLYEMAKNGGGSCTDFVGYSINFSYTGGIQEFVIPATGEYKVEVWGAQGGNYPHGSKAYGGNGGYSYAYAYFEKNNKVYIGVGGQGESPLTDNVIAKGGYNGGGNGSDVQSWSQYNWTIGGAGGGGASHIAINQNLGELKNYKDNKDDILIVAGGGGGAGANSGSAVNQYNNGGYGGGSSAGDGTNRMVSNYSGFTAGYGSTTEELRCPFNQASILCGGFGYGGSNNATDSAGQASGGGAGWYGGSASANYGTSGGGGSGYIKSSLTGATVSGNQSMPDISSENTTTGHEGNGYARITFVG